MKTWIAQSLGTKEEDVENESGSRFDGHLEADSDGSSSRSFIREPRASRRLGGTSHEKGKMERGRKIRKEGATPIPPIWNPP